MMATRRGALEQGAPGQPGGADRSVERLEHALFAVARTILRFGIPAQVLRDGEHIDRAGYWMLTRLDESVEPMRLSDLAAVLDLDLSTVSRQARQLVDAGLVTRAADLVDRRACRVSVSERGRAVLDAVRAARHDALRSALRAWPESERGALASSLARLARDMSAPVREMAP